MNQGFLTSDDNLFNATNNLDVCWENMLTLRIIAWMSQGCIYIYTYNPNISDISHL